MKIQNGFSIKPDSPEQKATKLDGQLREASQMYENYFLNEMVRAMRATVPREGGLMKPSFAEKIFEQQLDQQYVDGWAKKGGVGLADMIYNQINDKFQAGLHQNARGPLPRGPMPIAPKKDAMDLPNGDSIRVKSIPPGPTSKLEYRFEVPQPSGVGFEAQAPMAGHVLETQTLDEGWNIVRLNHGQGVTSELTFPGSIPQLAVGHEVKPGQKLGELDSKRPVLAWKLDWS